MYSAVQNSTVQYRADAVRSTSSLHGVELSHRSLRLLEQRHRIGSDGIHYQQREHTFRVEKSSPLRPSIVLLLITVQGSQLDSSLGRLGW